MNRMYINADSGEGVINEITPNLFLGNMFATDPNILYQYNIDVVLNVSTPQANINNNRYKLKRYLLLPIDDVPSAAPKMINEVIPKAMRFLDQFLHPAAPQKTRVLVHCHAGVSRSATVVLAWLMKHFKLDRDKALSFLRSRRSIVNPNEGFMNILKQWENYLKRFHRDDAVGQRRDTTRGRAYNYPGINSKYEDFAVAPGVVPLKDNRDYKSHLKHHLFQDQIDHYDNMQIRQFERRFSVIPSESDTLVKPQEAPSYYREFEEKMHSNDDHFKHLY